MDPDLYLVMVSVVSTALGLPIAIGIARRLARGGTPKAAPAVLSPDVDARLQRIEQAVDAIAVEMERVSEGQRFTTRLLAERSAPADQTR